MKTLSLALLLALAACAHQEPAAEVAVVLTGATESPPVQTAATGQALIVVDEDGTVHGVVTAPGIPGATVAIEDDADAAVPVVVMLVPAGDGRWQVPSGTRLTAAQLDHYKRGRLSANVRSRAHPKGEVRAQLPGRTRTTTGYR
jgi:hypothetical protein